MKLKRGDAIRVDWIDASGSGGWGNINEFTPPDIRTVGFFIKQDKAGVYYTSGIDADAYVTVLRPGFIPLGCIRKIRKLK